MASVSTSITKSKDGELTINLVLTIKFDGITAAPTVIDHFEEKEQKKPEFYKEDKVDLMIPDFINDDEDDGGLINFGKRV